MRSLLNDVTKKGVVSIEVSNAASDFWNSIKAKGLSEATYQTNPALSGKAILDLVESWRIILKRKLYMHRRPISRILY